MDHGFGQAKLLGIAERQVFGFGIGIRRQLQFFDDGLGRAFCRQTPQSGDQPQMIPAVDGNGFDVIYERTSKLTVKQCGELIEWVHAFGAEHQVRWTQKDNWGGRY